MVFSVCVCVCFFVEAATFHRIKNSIHISFELHSNISELVERSLGSILPSDFDN